MNTRVVSRLIVKDCSLMRWPIAAYTLVALVALGLAASGAASGRSAGITLALNVLIGVSFHVILGPVLGERERKTLAFVMSLPASPGDAALAKIASAFALFLVPASVAATALIFFSPVPVFGAAAYALVLGAWLLFFSVVLAAAIVSESIGWTIAVMTGLVFVFGNGVLQVAPKLRWVLAYIEDVARGGPAISITLLVEAVGIALVVAVMLMLQRRKTSFV